MKWCQSGQHEVDKLWWAKRKDRLSACKDCAMKNKPKAEYGKSPLNEVVKVYAEVYKITSVTANTSHTTRGMSNNLRSLPELLKLATIVFNKWIRNRDTSNGYFKCICCSNQFKSTEMDAAHYFNAGNHSATRFDEDNVHGCCVSCNRFLDGNLKAYQLNLHNKIGYERLGALALKARCVYKWDKEQLLSIINKYK